MTTAPLLGVLEEEVLPYFLTSFRESQMVVGWIMCQLTWTDQYV